MRTARMCVVCGKMPAEVPDREQMGRPIKRVCLACHRKRLAGDVRKIIATLPTVEVKCVGCGNVWSVGAGKVPAGQMPECSKCFSFGVATRAQGRGGER